MDFQAQAAIYLQIANQIADRILNGEWQSGERIPSVRDLASEIQVNPNTVLRAYSYLQEEQIIVNQRGIGYFVAEDGAKKVKILKKTAFLSDLLPQLFREMELMGISWEEMQQHYHSFNQKK
jgi:GntR family transcriptional regulator